MPEIDLKPVFTSAGLAAIAAAHAQGLALKLTHVSLGAGGYPVRDVDGLPLDEARARTALADEQVRVTLEAGGSIAPHQVLLAGTVEAGTPEFWIREVGFWSEEGILIALWASDTTNLGWRGLVPWVFRFVLAWQDLPADAIQVVYDGDAGMAALLLESNRLEATVRHTVQTAGLARDPGDPSQLTLAIRAHVPVATTAVHGKTRLATAAEARAANLHDVAVTPAGVRQAVHALAGAVRRPKITAPAAGAVDVTVIPTVGGDPYYSLYGIAQAAAQVQVATDAGFGSIVHDSGALGPVTSYDVPSAVLATDTTYHSRIRYQDAEGTWSEWSEPVSFSTGSTLSYIVRPAVTAPVDGATGVSLTPALASGAMSVANGADTHAASQWQVAAGTAGAADWGATVYDSGETGDLVAHQVPAGHLTQVLAAYSVRVRHRGAALGWSEWSTVASFTTAARPSTPMLTAPAAGATGVSLTPTLQSSAFSIVGVSDSHVASQWQVSTDPTFATTAWNSGETADLISHQVPAAAGLSALTVYYARVRHKGSGYGWSEWSQAVQFTSGQPVGEQTFTTPGTHTFVVPLGVTSLSGVVIGGGGGGQVGAGVEGGGGGLRYKNGIPVTPGEAIPITVGIGGASYHSAHGAAGNGGTSSIGSHVSAYGGIGGYHAYGTYNPGDGGGGVGGDGGGDGGDGSGLYGGSTGRYDAEGPSGVLPTGTGLTGTGSTADYGRGGCAYLNIGPIQGAPGAVRLIWGNGRTFPDNAV